MLQFLSGAIVGAVAAVIWLVIFVADKEQDK